ncbi:unnamed protein product [Menidia menidia]|uniref:Rho GDP-dissociation inhibitor 1 n=1 Tax=Menidia menidia TaxID=238744 RepID=A0A8S4BGW3_9TELE|nr:unnamed protein product [Menidia menidia]
MCRGTSCACGRGGAVPLFAILAREPGAPHALTAQAPVIPAEKPRGALEGSSPLGYVSFPDDVISCPPPDMAEDDVTPEQLAAIAAENEEPEPVNYRPPAQKSVREIQELDKDDESLRKYKEALLGPGMSLMCEAAPNPLVLDLQGDLEAFKKQAFVLKEGVEYKIKISFKVNREIVSGLKYVQQTFRKGMKIDRSDYMVGSYGPRRCEYEFLTSLEEAPRGLLARGHYVIRSRFTDDDQHDHLSWEWNLNIKKDWTD